MWIFNRSVDDLVEDDLRSLIENRVPERVTLDFKRDMYGGSPADLKKMNLDVAALANADGGTIILGMDEDDDSVAHALVPVPNAEVEAGRIIQSCNASIAERVPGLKARPVPIAGGGAVIVVHIPQSYRKPHMVTLDRKTDFWIRHDRHNNRMSIAEIRACVTSTEDMEMKAERFIQERRQQLEAQERPFAAITATPLSLQGGRIDAYDSRLIQLLRNADDDASYGLLLTGGQTGRPTVRGRRADNGFPSTCLEVFRNGHIEFFIREESYLKMRAGARPPLVNGHAVAEFLFRVIAFSKGLARTFDIADPYIVTLALWRLEGLSIPTSDRAGEAWPDGSGLCSDPVIVGVDEDADAALRRILDPIWNAFGHERCHLFVNGKFTRPQR